MQTRPVPPSSITDDLDKFANKLINHKKCKNCFFWGMKSIEDDDDNPSERVCQNGKLGRLITDADFGCILAAPIRPFEQASDVFP